MKTSQNLNNTVDLRVVYYIVYIRSDPAFKPRPLSSREKALYVYVSLFECKLVKSASDSSDPKQTYIHLIPPCPHHTDKCFCNADSIAQHRSKIN